MTMAENGEAPDEGYEGDRVNVSSPGWSTSPLCNDVFRNIQLLTSGRECSSPLNKETDKYSCFKIIPRFYHLNNQFKVL